METRNANVARFFEIARLCGPAVTDAQIWARVRQERDDAAADTIRNGRIARELNASDAADFEDFDAADRANGWA